MNKPEKKTRKNYTTSERLQNAINARIKKEQTYLNAKMELENHDKVIEKLRADVSKDMFNSLTNEELMNLLNKTNKIDIIKLISEGNYEKLNQIHEN